MLSTLQSIFDTVGVHVDIIHWIELLALILGRVTPAVLLAPFLGGRAVPSQIKVGLSLILSVLLMPSLGTGRLPIPQSPLVLIALLAKEIVIGAVIGLLAQLPFYAIQMAGTIIDTQRGLNQITYLAPQLEGHVSALGSLQFQASIVLFLLLQGHLVFLRAIGDSFRTLPILEIPHMEGGVLPIATLAARTSANALLLAFEIAAPVVLACFLSDVAFATLGRAASQIRISNDANTAKSLLGLGVVFLVTLYFLEPLQRGFSELSRAIDAFARVMK